MYKTRSDATQHKLSPGRAGGARAGGEPREFDWEAFVPRLIHPVKVAIIEALLWIGTPMSAKELAAVLGPRSSTGLVSYHLRHLGREGLLEEVGQRPARGAVQRFYFFPACSWEPGSGWLEA
jgi:Helix-turn-helix domain